MFYVIPFIHYYLHTVSAGCGSRCILGNRRERVGRRTHAIRASLHVASNAHGVEQSGLEIHEGIYQNHQK